MGALFRKETSMFGRSACAVLIGVSFFLGSSVVGCNKGDQPSKAEPKVESPRKPNDPKNAPKD